jgi:hypothetical protein
MTFVRASGGKWNIIGVCNVTEGRLVGRNPFFGREST